VIDDKPKTSEEAVAELPAEEITPPAVEDKEQPLSFHIDFEPTPSDKPKDS
jgi:hypothetical protein